MTYPLPYKALISYRAEPTIVTCVFRNTLTNQTFEKSFSNLTVKQIEQWLNGEHIQRALSTLSYEDRELFITGISYKEWKEMFGDTP